MTAKPECFFSSSPIVLGHINNQLHKNNCVRFVSLFRMDLSFYIYIFKNKSFFIIFHEFFFFIKSNLFMSVKNDKKFVFSKHPYD